MELTKNSFAGLRLLFISTTLIISVTVLGQDWLSGSSYRRTITFNSIEFDENVTDMLYYFTVTDDALMHEDECSQVKNPNGFDIRFTDDAQPPNMLNHEIIEFDSNTGLYRGWVRVPTVSSAANEVIYMYYGDRTLVLDPSTTDAFADDLLGVWHLDNTNTNTDATANGNDLTLTGPSVQTNNCITDECILFNEEEQDVASINDPDFDFGARSFTLEGWFNIQPKLGASPIEFVQVFAESSQHAEEALNTSDFQVDGNVLQLGRNLSQWNDFTRVGIQFESVGIPRTGHVVTDAYIEFVAQEDGIGFARFDIGVEDTDSPALFELANPPTNRNLVMDGLDELLIEWLPTSWVEGETYRTSNLACIIQPIVDGAWLTRNLSFVIQGFGVREADNDGIRLVVEYENQDPEVATEYQLAVATPSDDAEERASDDEILLGSPLSFTNSGGNANNMIGIRFDNVAIPNNAVIEGVRVMFTANSDATSATEIIIRRAGSPGGGPTFNSDPFIVESNYISSLLDAEDPNQVTWNPVSWVGGDQNTTTETPDLTSLFTDFFSNFSWSSGNAFTLLFQPISGSRTAVSRGTSAESGPQLIIDYTIPENETQTIISRHNTGGGFSTWVDRTGKLNFGIDNDPLWDPDVVVTSLDNVDDSQWYHFGAVKEDDRLTLYLNGEPQDSRTENHVTRINLIENSADDAEEDLGDGSVTLDGANGLGLQWGTDGGGDQQIIGLRFFDVELPPDATIVSSFIQIVSSTNDDNGTGACEVEIKGFAGNFPNVFQGTGGELSGFFNASGSPIVDWSIDPFSTDNPMDPVIASAFNSPDISNIIAYAATTANGWQSGDNLAFFIRGVPGTNQRETRAIDSPTSGQGGVATLVIEFKENDYGSISGGGTTTMYIGDDPDHLANSDENLQGRLDEFRIYNSALSADKVKAQYQTIAEAETFSSLAGTPEQVTWTGAAGDEDWGTGGNWNTGLAPWDNMDFVYDPGVTANSALIPMAGLTAGHLTANAPINLNEQQLIVDCSWSCRNVQ